VPTACPPGHYCPAGTASARESQCGRARYEQFTHPLTHVRACPVRDKTEQC
jgi:hypothetical protein